MVFPAPGTPIKLRWCPPAAAISNACRARNAPRTSCKSGGSSGTGSGINSGETGASLAFSSATRVFIFRIPKYSNASTRCDTPIISIPSISEASATASEATITFLKPARRAAKTWGRIPLTRYTRPSKPSSPQNTILAARFCTPAYREATTASAIGKSKPDPVLGNSAGERLTVNRVGSKRRPVEAIAASTRDRDSLSEASGSPTSANAGNPWVWWASTLIRWPLNPTIPRAKQVPIWGILNPPAVGNHRHFSRGSVDRNHIDAHSAACSRLGMTAEPQAY